MDRTTETLSQVYGISETSRSTGTIHGTFHSRPPRLLPAAIGRHPMSKSGQVAKVLLAANLGRHHPPSTFQDITVDSEGE